MHRPKRCDLVLLIGSMLVLLASCGLILPPMLLAEDVTNVQRDQDKTVYTIGSGSQNKQEDQDKAWEMLRNGYYRVPKKKPDQPTQNRQAQPEPGK